MTVRLCRPMHSPLLVLALLVVGCGQTAEHPVAPTTRGSSQQPITLDAAGQASLARLGALAAGQGRPLTLVERHCRTTRGSTRPYRDCSFAAYARYGEGQHLNGSIARGLAGALAIGGCRSSLTGLANTEAFTGELSDELVAALNSGRAWRTLVPAVAGIGRLRTVLGHAYNPRALSACNVATPAS